MTTHHKLLSLNQFSHLVGEETIERIREKARPLHGMHIAHVNSTYYGGGVAEMLSPLTLLMNDVGIKTGWRIIQGSPDFFSITKKIHNALQGADINLSKRKLQIYEEVIEENVMRNHLIHDLVIIHDPQPLPLINHYKKKGPWIWRCHIDLSRPHGSCWSYLEQYISKFDAVIMSIEEYKQNIKPPQYFFFPTINPFSIKNREMSDKDIDERLKHHGIPTDLPIVVQISRFDPWKDPEGVIQAFKIARKEINATLVLLGNVATDDPEGPKVYHSLLSQREERIIIKSEQDSSLVNALQRKAAVVVQKSLREGFGLTVTEAMWKGAAVVAGNVGGIRYQIENGVNGYLVSNVEETAARIVELLKSAELRREMGVRARETVKNRFLMTGLLERYLDLFNSFETIYKVK